MNSHSTYDYIIAGAGCAGLSLLMHLIHSGKFNHKRILLIDKEQKNKNDRTWCFWEEGEGIFQPIVYKDWEQLFFHSEDLSTALQIHPYKYKLIRGIDFYAYCFNELRKHSNITVLESAITDLVSNRQESFVVAGNERYKASYIFSSILFDKPQLHSKQYWLLQHFRGWVIESPDPVFNPSVATLMDFKTDQSAGAAFYYVLPFTENKALVEYTLFSKERLAEPAYEQALKTYVEEKLGIATYHIRERESGIIPMTNYSFPLRQHNLIYIGTAGGQTKASSGYTFRFIQKQSAMLAKNLQNEKLLIPVAKKRFHFYDSLLLHILNYNKMPGDKIFTQLFRNNKAAKVLKFLDNETTVQDEIKIIKSLPAGIFLEAAFKHLF